MKTTRTLAALGLSALVAFSIPVAWAEENTSAEEKALEQSLSTDEPIEEGHTEISHGHVDMGPKYVDGKWELMFHDGHETEPVWRSPSDVVLKGGNSALLPKPDDPRYDFVSGKAGDEVYVIPQTEAEGVVWPGWNTQDPGVVSKLDKGVTFTLDKVEGPGQFNLYLENGNFSEPQVLWSSDKSEKQDIFVDPNTHTHANWDFPLTIADTVMTGRTHLLGLWKRPSKDDWTQVFTALDRVGLTELRNRPITELTGGQR